MIASSSHGWIVAESALKTTLGTQLRAWRHRQGLTQEQLAERLQVTPRYIAGVERGERNLSLDSVDTLAKQLGTVPRLLLDSADAAS